MGHGTTWEEPGLGPRCPDAHLPPSPSPDLEDQEETDTGGKKTNLPPCMLPTGKIYHHGTLFSLSGLDTFFFMDVVAELSIKVTILPAKNV